MRCSVLARMRGGTNALVSPAYPGAVALLRNMKQRMAGEAVAKAQRERPELFRKKRGDHDDRDRRHGMRGAENRGPNRHGRDNDGPRDGGARVPSAGGGGARDTSKGPTPAPAGGGSGGAPTSRPISPFGGSAA